MKKLKYLFILLLFIVPCTLLLGACSLVEETYITNIEEGVEPNSYVVTYSNGETSILTFDSSNDDNVYVTGIQKKEETETETVFTVSFSNNTTSVISCAKGVDGKDGADGVDGDDFTIEKLKEYATEKGYSNFDVFLKEYLSINVIDSNVKNGTNLALRSAVSIYSVCPYTTNNTLYYQISAGSGVVYSMDKSTNGYSYIITNYHVVYAEQSNNKIAIDIRLFQYGIDDTITVEKPSAMVNYYSNYTFPTEAVSCEYVGGSMNHDIAVLRVKTADLLKNNERTEPVTIADNYNIGETAIAIGNPEAEGISVTSGIVSVVSEELKMKGADESTTCTFRVMRIDTAVNGGNSGGGLFNEYGKLIGIVNAKVISTEVENISYALPIDNVKKVADNLIYYHEKINTASQVQKLNIWEEYSEINSKPVYTYNEQTKEYIISVANNLKISKITTTGKLCGLLKDDVINSITINNVTYNLNRAYEIDDMLLTVRSGDRISFNYTRGTTTTNTATKTVTNDYFTTIV